MGSSGANIAMEQIKSYYLFQRKLECVLKNKPNNILFSKNNSNFQKQKVYVINSSWINDWKANCHYDMIKEYFDKINFTSLKNLEQQMNLILDNLFKGGIVSNIDTLLFKDSINDYNKITRKKILEPNYFDCLVDTKTFKLLKDTGEVWYKSNEKEYILDIIISKRIIILLIKEIYLAKFLYNGEMECENQLIQLSAKCFDIEGEGVNSENIYKAFVNFLLSVDEQYLLSSFRNNNAGFMKNINMKLKEGYLIPFQNENLSKKYFDKEKKANNLNFANINNCKLIGLANIGATCYMNATLECFINIDPLTRYLLTESNYYQIINNTGAFELSSAYCDLLANVCLDESGISYFKPRIFKEVISWKNPIFEGVNANDSKDLINFMLEEMNQELSKINLPNNQQINNVNLNNPNIDQTNQQLTLNNFISQYVRNNDSIISRLFFFIIESKSQCQSCRTITYNYQALYSLEFPLESVFNFYARNNNFLINERNKKVINIIHCLEQYKEPTFFTGENRFFCNICKTQTDNLNSNVLYSLPPYLIIILNRGKGKSFDCLVEYPEYLNLQNYVVCPQSICNYRLCGVICHLGESGMSGHFISICRHRIKNEWYCYNDASVTRCNNQETAYKRDSAYILFYEFIDRKENILYSSNMLMNNNSNCSNNFTNNNGFNNNFNNINNNNFSNMNMNNMNNNCNVNNMNQINSMNNPQNSMNNCMNMGNNNFNVNNNMNNMNNMSNNNNMNNMKMLNNMMGNVNQISNNINNNMNNINNNLNNNMNGISNINNNMNSMNNNFNNNNFINNKNNNNMRNISNGMKNINHSFNNNINNMNGNMFNNMNNNMFNNTNNNIKNNNMNNNNINNSMNNNMNNMKSINNNMNFMSNNGSNGMNNNINNNMNNNMNHNMNNMNFNGNNINNMNKMNLNVNNMNMINQNFNSNNFNNNMSNNCINGNNNMQMNNLGMNMNNNMNMGFQNMKFKNNFNGNNMMINNNMINMNNNFNKNC